MKITPTLVDLLDTVDRLRFRFSEWRELANAVHRVRVDGSAYLNLAPNPRADLDMVQDVMAALFVVAHRQRVEAEAAAEKIEEAPDDLLRDALGALSNMSTPMPANSEVAQANSEVAQAQATIKKLHLYLDLKEQAGG